MPNPPELLYLDCSVYGGAFDPEFAAETLPLLELIRSGRANVAISPIVEDEVLGAPAHVLRLYREFEGMATVIRLAPAVYDLHRAYIEEGIVTVKSKTDALHVALATCGGCHGVVSWNMRHIVRPDKIVRYNAVNSLRGYSELTIRTPPEVFRNE
jgi:hypothetical protein